MRGVFTTPNILAAIYDFRGLLDDRNATPASFALFNKKKSSVSAIFDANAIKLIVDPLDNYSSTCVVVAVSAIFSDSENACEQKSSGRARKMTIMDFVYSSWRQL